jgi:hypothetical protein
VGGNSVWNSEFFAGYIDEVRVYSRALDVSEIRRDMVTPISGDGQPPATNQPPTADAGGPYLANAGEPVAFDGAGSSDPDGSIVSYDWVFGDGAIASGAAPSHAYSDSGTYTATLTVTDGDGAQGTSTASVTIEAAPNQSPAVSSVTATPSVLNEGDTSQLAVSASDPDGDTAR